MRSRLILFGYILLVRLLVLEVLKKSETIYLTKAMVRDYDYLTETVEPDQFSRWEEVDLEIYAFTDLGMKVAINDEYSGLVYGNQVYERYEEGLKL